MDHFTIVLPSNVKGSSALKNSASHYNTVFENSLQLFESEKWVVGLKEINFIDSIMTITKEDKIFIVSKEGAKIQDGAILELKPGYYKDAKDLLKAFPNLELKKYGFKIDFDEYLNRLKVIKLTQNDFLMTIYDDLSHILGFIVDNKFSNNDVLASHGPNLRRGIHSIFIYCDVCEETMVGEGKSQLLRVVNFNRQNYNDSVNIIYNDPNYIPVTKTFINNIEIKLCDDMGNFIPFEEGKTILTLHFKSL